MGNLPINGQQLLANYQSVFVSQATIQAAHYEADRSENELLQHLRGASGGTYLQPANLASGEQDIVTRASLDAHIKKVQADQLDSMNAYQFQELQQQTSRDYVGKRVQINVQAPEQQPIEIMWFDQQNGYRTSIAKRHVVNGVISEILLNKNALIIRPPVASRLMNSRLQSYIVYVIDPASCLPMVNITIR